MFIIDFVNRKLYAINGFKSINKTTSQCISKFSNVWACIIFARHVCKWKRLFLLQCTTIGDALNKCDYQSTGAPYVITSRVPNQCRPDRLVKQYAKMPIKRLTKNENGVLWGKKSNGSNVMYWNNFNNTPSNN